MARHKNHKLTKSALPPKLGWLRDIPLCKETIDSVMSELDLVPPTCQGRIQQHLGLLELRRNENLKPYGTHLWPHQPTIKDVLIRKR